MKKSLVLAAILSTLVLAGCSGAPDTTDWSAYSSEGSGFSVQYPEGLNMNILSTGAVTFVDPQEKNDTVFQVQKVGKSAAVNFAERGKMTGAGSNDAAATADGTSATSLCFEESGEGFCEYYVDVGTDSSFVVTDYSDLLVVRTFKVLKK